MRLRGHAVQRRQLWARHPATQTPSPGTLVGRAALPSAVGLAVDGESHIPNSRHSLHSSGLERCRISACLSMLPSGTKHRCFASEASYFWMAPSLLAMPWTIPDLGLKELAGMERRLMPRELLSLSLQDAWSDGRVELVFPLRCLCISRV